MSLSVIISNEEQEPYTVDAGSLIPGDIVYGSIFTYPKTALLITYSNVVDLNRPGRTWSPCKGIEIAVDYFMEGTLTLKRKAA